MKMHGLVTHKPLRAEMERRSGQDGLVFTSKKLIKWYAFPLGDSDKTSSYQIPTCPIEIPSQLMDLGCWPLRSSGAAVSGSLQTTLGARNGKCAMRHTVLVNEDSAMHTQCLSTAMQPPSQTASEV